MNTTATTTLTFDRDHIASLLKHSRDATHRSATITQQHLEHIPPGLWLVADGGVYLMSNGQNEEGQHGWRAHEPAYAKEADPGEIPFDEWQEVRAQVFDGSDGCEFIPADQAQDWCDVAIATIRLHLDDDSIGFTPDPAP